MIRKFFKVSAVIVLATAMSACRTTELDDDFGFNENGGSAYSEDGGFVDTPVMGEDTGLGGLPVDPVDNFKPFAPEMQKWDNIYFMKNKYTLSSSAKQKLDIVVADMLSNSDYALVIEGHCSIEGSTEFNRSLSEKRALAAQKYLIEKGVNTANINTVAYGEERPAIEGSSEAAHSKNRRDVFIMGTKE